MTKKFYAYLMSIDGTLTTLRVSKHFMAQPSCCNTKRDLQGITPEMKDFMLNIKKKVVIGLVGGL